MPEDPEVRNWGPELEPHALGSHPPSADWTARELAGSEGRKHRGPREREAGTDFGEAAREVRRRAAEDGVEGRQAGEGVVGEVVALLRRELLLCVAERLGEPVPVPATIDSGWAGADAVFFKF